MCAALYAHRLACMQGQGLLAGGAPQSGVHQGQGAAEELGGAAGGNAWRKGQAGTPLGGEHASAAPAGAAEVGGAAAAGRPVQQPLGERPASQATAVAALSRQHQLPAAGQQRQLSDARPGTAALQHPAVETMQRPGTAALQPLQHQGDRLQESGLERSPAASAARPSTAMVGELQQTGLAGSAATLGKLFTPNPEGVTAAAAAHKRPLRPHTAQAPMPVPALVTPRGQKRHMEAFVHSSRVLTAEARMDAWRQRQSSGAGQPTSGLPQRVEQLLQL